MTELTFTKILETLKSDLSTSFGENIMSLKDALSVKTTTDSKTTGEDTDLLLETSEKSSAALSKIMFLHSKLLESNLTTNRLLAKSLSVQEDLLSGQPTELDQRESALEAKPKSQSVGEDVGRELADKFLSRKLVAGSLMLREVARIKLTPIFGLAKMLNSRVISPLLNFASKGFTNLFPKLSGHLDDLLKSASTGLSSIKSSLGLGKEGGFLTRIKSFFAGAKSGFLTYVDGVLESMGWFGRALKGLVNFVKRAALPISLAVAAVRGLIDSIKHIAKTGEIGRGIGVFVKTAVASLFTEVLDILKNITSWVSKAFGFEKFASWLDSFSFTGLFNDAFDSMLDFYESIYSKIGEVLNPSFILDKVKDLSASLTQAASSFARAILQTFIPDPSKVSPNSVADFMVRYAIPNSVLDFTWGRQLDAEEADQFIRDTNRAEAKKTNENALEGRSLRAGEDVESYRLERANVAATAYEEQHNGFGVYGSREAFVDSMMKLMEQKSANRKVDTALEPKTIRTEAKAIDQISKPEKVYQTPKWMQYDPMMNFTVVAPAPVVNVAPAPVINNTTRPANNLLINTYSTR